MKNRACFKRWFMRTSPCHTAGSVCGADMHIVSLFLVTVRPNASVIPATLIASLYNFLGAIAMIIVKRHRRYIVSIQNTSKGAQYAVHSTDSGSTSSGRSCKCASSLSISARSLLLSRTTCKVIAKAIFDLEGDTNRSHYPRIWHRNLRWKCCSGYGCAIVPVYNKTPEHRFSISPVVSPCNAYAVKNTVVSRYLPLPCFLVSWVDHKKSYWQTLCPRFPIQKK